MTSDDTSRPATAAELAAALTPERLVADFAAHLYARTDRLDERTVARHVRYVERWFAYASGRSDVDPLAPHGDDVARFATRVPVAVGRGRGRRGNARPSAEVTRQRLSSLATFFDWAHMLGLAPANPARPLPRPRHKGDAEDVRRLTPAEVAATLAAARADGPPAYAVFRALADLGVRGVEIQRARCGDYRPGADGGPVLHTVGRRGFPSTRPLPAPTVEALDEALEWRRVVAPHRSLTHAAGPLFTAPRYHRHGPPGALDAARFSTLFRRVLRAADVDRPEEITPHAYRHAWVRHGVACGWAVTTVQAEIGHRHLSSTLRYLVGGVGDLHPLAATVRPLAQTVADSVVMLRAISGGERLPVTEELAARRRRAAEDRRQAETLRELYDARTEAAAARAELDQMRARLAALDPDFALDDRELAA